ncbi:hypothetical protein [Chondromyces crocatus]|uniref:hypothetical protein n=1 Tax=Chondromyces crocatus TaxID=52 RepID=UPI0012E15FB8|nr:hypothetical protein [Chondromyces crocatus]
MDHHTAKRVVENLNKAIVSLNEGIQVLMSQGSESEVRAFRRGVGHTMAEIYDRLADPIFREHPALVPDDADYEPEPGPILAELGSDIGEP